MKFLHTADWQLGMTRHFLDLDAQARYSAARRDAVSALGALAAETGAEFVVVAGDVFDANQLAPKVVSQSLNAMRGIGVPVYLLPGNHDPLDASSVYTSALFTKECPENVTVLDRAGVFDVRPGVQIVAAPWRSKRPTADLTAEVLAELRADGTARILLAHGAVDVLDPDPLISQEGWPVWHSPVAHPVDDGGLKFGLHDPLDPLIAQDGVHRVAQAQAADQHSPRRRDVS